MDLKMEQSLHDYARMQKPKQMATALQDSRAKERKRDRVRTKQAYRNSLAVQAKKKVKPTKGTSLDAPWPTTRYCHCIIPVNSDSMRLLFCA